MNTQPDIRWQQRFQNFRRAFMLLRSALEDHEVDDYTQLEQEGIIQRFEYTFELAWKTLKDYLEFGGIQLEIVTPRNVIRECVASGLFKEAGIDGDIYLTMMLARNTLSHTYDFDKFRDIILKLQSEYLPQLDREYTFLLGQLIKDTDLNAA